MASTPFRNFTLSLKSQQTSNHPNTTSRCVRAQDIQPCIRNSLDAAPNNDFTSCTNNGFSDLRVASELYTTILLFIHSQVVASYGTFALYSSIRGPVRGPLPTTRCDAFTHLHYHKKSSQFQGPIWSQRSIIVEWEGRSPILWESLSRRHPRCSRKVLAVPHEGSTTKSYSSPSIDACSASNTQSLLSRHSDYTWSLYRDGTWGRSYGGLSK